MNRQKKIQSEDLDLELKMLNSEKLKLEMETEKALLSKIKKDEEKTVIEIAQLKAAWFRRPQWAAFYVPLIMCLGSLWIFNKQSSYQDEKASSQYKNTVLEHERDSLSGIIVSFKKVITTPQISNETINLTSSNTQLVSAINPEYQSTLESKSGNNKLMAYDCDQQCGQGHFSMRGTIVVETQEDYDKWLKAYSVLAYNMLQDSTLNISDAEIAAYVVKHKRTFAEGRIAPM